MLPIFLTLFSVAFLCSSAYAETAADRVNVTVYIESLCPDTHKFFNKQLYPVLQTDLGKYVNLKLIPFGKSTQKKNEKGEIEFECHHGPKECDANKIQACAIEHIAEETNAAHLGYNKITVDFINCLMSEAQKIPYPDNSCATKSKVSNYDDIHQCSEGKMGTNLLSKFGNLTDKFQKPLKNVPTVVFNEQYNEIDTILAEVNFKRALCQQLTQNIQDEHYELCHIYNGTVKKSISSVVALINAVILFYFLF